MKKIWLYIIIILLVFAICFFSLICKKMICIDGKLYRSTGKELTGEFVAEEGIEITSSVKWWKKPTEHGQSNFDKTGKVCVPYEDGFAVSFREWIYFEPC